MLSPEREINCVGPGVNHDDGIFSITLMSGNLHVIQYCLTGINSYHGSRCYGISSQSSGVCILFSKLFHSDLNLPKRQNNFAVSSFKHILFRRKGFGVEKKKHDSAFS